jgi:ABC-type amino acid transport substrate-binding protein
MIISRLKLFFMLFLFPGLCAAQNYSGDSWSKVAANGSGVIRFAYVETPRFVYRDGSGNITGISVDIIADFVSWVNKHKKVKLTSEFVGDGSSFRVMYEKVRSSSGGVFGLGNITITPQRKKEVRFSPPMITNFSILISNGNLKPLNDLNEMATVFKGAQAYAAKGTTNADRMIAMRKEYLPDMKLSYTTTSQETLEKIANDPTGFGYLDLAFYLEAVQMKKNIRRHPAGDKAAEQFGFIMPKNSDWHTLMEEFFSAEGGYTSSARYRAILQKHFGQAGMKLLKTSAANL